MIERNPTGICTGAVGPEHPWGSGGEHPFAGGDQGGDHLAERRLGARVRLGGFDDRIRPGAPWSASDPSSSTSSSSPRAPGAASGRPRTGDGITRWGTLPQLPTPKNAPPGCCTTSTCLHSPFIARAAHRRRGPGQPDGHAAPTTGWDETARIAQVRCRSSSNWRRRPPARSSRQHPRP